MMDNLAQNVKVFATVLTRHHVIKQVEYVLMATVNQAGILLHVVNVSNIILSIFLRKMHLYIILYSLKKFLFIGIITRGMITKYAQKCYIIIVN